MTMPSDEYQITLLVVSQHGSDGGFSPSGNKSLPEPVLTQVSYGIPTPQCIKNLSIRHIFKFQIMFYCQVSYVWRGYYEYSPLLVPSMPEPILPGINTNNIPMTIQIYTINMYHFQVITMCLFTICFQILMKRRWYFEMYNLFQLSSHLSDLFWSNFFLEKNN